MSRGPARSQTAEGPRDGISTIEILGVRYAALDAEGALAEAERLHDRPEPAWIAIENVHGVNIANADPSYMEALQRADLVLNDGKGVMLGARLLGARFPEDLNGNVFCPLLLARAAERRWGVFLLGAAPGVVERAAEQLRRRFPALRIVGCRNGFIAPEEEREVVEQIRDSGADLIVVGMGMPLQERWLDRNLAATGVPLGTTAGALFDFQAGHIPRAPAWMSRLGLEWIFRLVKEPRRMWRRYVVGNPLFVGRVLKERLGS